MKFTVQAVMNISQFKSIVTIVIFFQIIFAFFILETQETKETPSFKDFSSSTKANARMFKAARRERVSKIDRVYFVIFFT